MINLKETTLIIPIKVEHPDRLRNAKTVLGYLNSNLETNVFIFEISDGESKLDFLDQLGNLKIKHWLCEPEPAFHRTKYLNMMLDEVETPVVSNYDIDVIISPENYLESQNSILNREFDVVYPYEFGPGQRAVREIFDYPGFELSGYDINFIDSDPRNYLELQAEFGHCIFFNTDVYRKFGAENENFISYGPEDKERGFRFSRLGMNVTWKHGYKIYHFEHHRGTDSSPMNPYIIRNWDLFHNLNQMNSEDLLNYYLNVEYLKKYKKIGK
jgi:hypothetical protein